MRNPTIIWQRAVTFTVIEPRVAPNLFLLSLPTSPTLLLNMCSDTQRSSATIITCSQTGCSLSLWSIYDGIWWWSGASGGGEHVGVGGCKTSLGGGGGRQTTDGPSLSLSLSGVRLGIAPLSSPRWHRLFFRALIPPTASSSSSFLSSHFSNLSPLFPLPLSISSYHNCTSFSPSSKSLDFTPPIPPSHLKYRYATSNSA